MMEYRFATASDIDALIKSRLEVLRIVNDLEEWNRGATEISLDATESGRPLYRKCGFKDSDECMVLVRKN